MELESVTLKLPRELLSGAQRVATARDVTIGHMVRVLLNREVERQLQSQTGCTDAQLLMALQVLLAPDMADAVNWPDLAERLRMHGYGLRRCNGDLVLVKQSCGTRVCESAELGFGYDAFVTRFGTQMPGHRQTPSHLAVMPAGGIDPTREQALKRHVAQAADWADLSSRLGADGMDLRPMGAGLGVHVAATGRHLCNTATLGACYKTLVGRFGAEMPGHPDSPESNVTAGSGPDADAAADVGAAA